MITISRGNAPASLVTDDIKHYIDECIIYMSNPETAAKPQKPKSYRNSEVLDAFDRDFHAKCYLTEQKFVNSYLMDIDHFIPQTERPDLVYEWTNLFPADHHANMMKPRSTPAGGYLNPCDEIDNVETDITYSLSPFGIAPHFEATCINNTKAVNTSQLLMYLHNGNSTYTHKVTATLREAIRKKYLKILHKIVIWADADTSPQEKSHVEVELKQMLSRASSFSMLCRSIPAARQLPSYFFD